MPTKSSMPPPVTRTPRPGDATLSVTKAARVLGVHPNTVRAWSEAGRLRYYRINDRGDRRYRLNDLQRFLAAAESGRPGAVESRTGAPARGPPRCARRPTAQTLTESTAGLDLLADLAEVASLPAGLDPALDEACRRIRLATGAALVGDLGAPAGRPRPAGDRRRGARDHRGPGRRPGSQPVHARPRVRRSRSTRGPATDGPPRCSAWAPTSSSCASRAARRRGASSSSPGAMVLGPDDGTKLAGAIARTLGVLVRGASATEQATSRLRRSEALRRVATDLASRLDVGDVVRDLSDHARVLFGADRVAVVLRDPEGRISSPGGTGFSESFLAIARDLEESRTGSRDIPPRRPVAAARARRAALGQPGPRRRGPGGRRHAARGAARRRPRAPRRRCTSPTTGRTAGARATSTAPRRSPGDAAIAVRSARTFGRMAAWAAQLQSIQRLGARLSGLTDVPQIGHAIATELRQLIDYENARVYRVRDESLVPGRDAGLRRGLRRREPRLADRRRRRGHHGLGRAVPGAAAGRRHGQRPAGGHDPGHRGGPRRVDAPRADGPRGRVPGRRRPEQARAAPVHRGRPAAARHLRVVRGPGDGQRRLDRSGSAGSRTRSSGSCSPSRP